MEEKTEGMRDLGNRVIILSNQLKHYLHRAAEEEGISGSLSRILHFVWLSEKSGKDIYQRDVEEFFCLRRSTITQNLKLMEKNGLITRMSVAKDARLKKLELTEKGRALEAKIHVKVERMEEMLREELTEEEITRFLNTVKKMSEDMEKLGVPPRD